jgi:hypothetical protein
MEISISRKTLKIGAIVLVSVIGLVLLQNIIKSKGIDEDCVEGVCGVEEMEEEKITAEKIEVVHFHATQQCWSCIELGRLAKLTLEKRFPEELESGFIEFKEVNVELPENSDIVEKYQASGSSLFVNYIYDGEDHIEEEVQVWRLLSSEIQFRKYLGDKLEKYL